VIDFFENIGKFIDNGAGAWTVTKLYLFKIPYITNLILPIAMLLASLFSLGRLSRDYELTAIMASGRSLPRILAPIFIFATLVSVASYFFNDQVVTRSNLALEDLEQYEIDKKPQTDRTVRRQIHKIGEDGVIYWAEAYYVSQNRFENLILFRFQGSRLMEYTKSRHAFWAGDHWRMVNGVRHIFTSADGQARPEDGSFEFESLDLTELEETPEDFRIEEKNPEAMNTEELRTYIVDQANAGEDMDRLWVDLHVKVSFPWANLIIVLMGSALSASKRRISAAGGFGLTVGVAFIYLIFLRIGLSLGHNHTLPPLLAAWVANIFFLLVGFILLRRASR
jgi:lipopolysaccharide export system permease protein